MAELAAAAGISRATLNRRFSSREALVKETLGAALRSVAVVIDGHQPLRASIEALCRIGPRLTVLLRHADILESDPDLSGQAQTLLGALEASVQAARDARQLRRDMPIHWQLRVIADLVWSGWSAVEAGEIGPEVCGALVWRSLMEGQQPAQET